MKLYYPIKNFTVIQGFGVNPTYYSKFIDACGKPEKGHMGVDLQAPSGTPLHAPCDGTAQYLEDAHGGDGIHIRVYDGNYYRVILWHLYGKNEVLKPLIPTDGSLVQVKAGQLIGYTDNSGAPYESSGPHLHVGVMACGPDYTALEPCNGFGGCIDVAPFWNGEYAEDLIKEQIVEKASEAVNLISQDTQTPASVKVGWLQKIFDWINNL